MVRSKGLFLSLPSHSLNKDINFADNRVGYRILVVYLVSAAPLAARRCTRRVMRPLSAVGRSGTAEIEYNLCRVSR